MVSTVTIRKRWDLMGMSVGGHTADSASIPWVRGAARGLSGLNRQTYKIQRKLTK